MLQLLFLFSFSYCSWHFHEITFISLSYRPKSRRIFSDYGTFSSSFGPQTWSQCNHAILASCLCFSPAGYSAHTSTETWWSHGSQECRLPLSRRKCTPSPPLWRWTQWSIHFGSASLGSCQRGGTTCMLTWRRISGHSWHAVRSSWKEASTGRSAFMVWAWPLTGPSTSPSSCRPAVRGCCSWRPTPPRWSSWTTWSRTIPMKPESPWHVRATTLLSTLRFSTQTHSDSMKLHVLFVYP